MKNITFKLTNTYGTTVTATPIFSDDISLVTSREQGQIFFRTKLDGRLVFVRDDYNWIMAQPFDSYIAVEITVEKNGNAIKWKGRFSRIDCTINEVDKTLKVTPEVYDRYSDILDAYEKEFDLLQIGTRNYITNINVPPALQIYNLGADVITNYWQGEIWETDITAVTSRNALINMGFSDTYGYMRVQGTGVGTSFGGAEYDSDVVILHNSQYMLRVEKDGDNYTCYLFPDGGGVEIAHGTGGNTVALYNRIGQLVTTLTITDIAIYARITSASTSPIQSGASLYPLTSDFPSSCKWHTNAEPLLTNSLGLSFKVSDNFSNTPNKYGVNSYGQYYLPPSESGFLYYPIFKENWTNTFSLWLTVAETQTAAMDVATVTRIDGFKLEDVLAALLTANNLSAQIQFAATVIYSRFFFYAYPLTNPITGWDRFRLSFIPKSNIANGNYTQAATKAPCTLKTVFDFLAKAMNVYWDITNDGRLRMEHIYFYHNGGSYDDAPTTQIDLREVYNRKSGKPWAFGQDEYTFEKYNLPEKLTWTWMDESDTYFDGTGIECISANVQKGSTEETNIADVTTNLNYILMHPEDVSLDGYAVAWCDYDTEQRGNVETATFRREGDTLDYWTTQNPQLAMWNLQQNLLRYQMPTATVQASGITFIQAERMKRAKTNEVVFPSLDADPLQHISTNVGDGEIETIENNISKFALKIKLRYENYT